MNNRQMKEILFTIFHRLAQQEDEELEEIFRTERPQKVVSSIPNNLHEFIINEKPISYQEAQVKAAVIFDLMLKCEDEMVAFNTLKKELTPQGLAHLMCVLAKHHSADMTEKINAFLTPMEYYQFLFRGMPTAQVKVKKNEKQKNGIGGCYDICYYFPSLGRDKVIEFESKESKALYLWFLLHPRLEMSKHTIKNNLPSLLDVYDILYPGDERLQNKLNAEGIKNGRDGFDSFFLQAKSTANRDIEKAWDGWGDSDWFIIYFDHEKYALSLLKESIILPKELEEYKNNHPLISGIKNFGV